MAIAQSQPFHCIYGVAAIFNCHTFCGYASNAFGTLPVPLRYTVKEPSQPKHSNKKTLHSNHHHRQIVEQLKILISDKFEFDKFTEKNVRIYPIIVHTNFTYQMPGINHYLNNEFQNLVREELEVNDLYIEPLVLFDLDSLFDFLQIEDMNLNFMVGFIKRYNHILESRVKRFERAPSQDNFVRARASFDEVFSTIIEDELKYHPVPRRVEIFLNSIGMTNETLDTF